MSGRRCLLTPQPTTSAVEPASLPLGPHLVPSPKAARQPISWLSSLW
jgi:hypothetical protein